MMDGQGRNDVTNLQKETRAPSQLTIQLGQVCVGPMFSMTLNNDTLPGSAGWRAVLFAGPRCKRRMEAAACQAGPGIDADTRDLAVYY